MRIYVFKYFSNEADWVFAPTMKEAKEFYLKHTGCGDLEGCTVELVPKKEWNIHYILDINEAKVFDDEIDNEDDYCGGYRIIETFAEYAERNTQTDMIATTAF